MTAFYDDLADTATDLLAEFGQTVTITRVTPGAYNKATRSASVTTASQTVSGAVFEYSSFIRSGLKNEPGTLIQQGDKQLLTAATALDGTALTAPEPNDRATVNGVDYTITAVAPTSPAGTPVYYECNLRV